MPAHAGESRWDERIARARALASTCPAAAEALTFYAGLAEYQRSLFLTARPSPNAAEFVDAIDVAGASAAVPDFLGWLERSAPAPLASAAGTIRSKVLEWHRLMREYLTRDAGTTGARSVHARPEEEEVDPARAANARAFADVRAFVMDAVLQPYAEAAAIERRADLGSEKFALKSQCPICSGPPCLGILRPEGQGAKRMLLCARCLTEWEYVRVVCPSCAEEGFDALPVYTADAFPHVRIEACDSCRRYLKTIDMTRDGLAVALVDDIASVPLDLWAGEHGYQRLRDNLLRTGDHARVK
jgi:FdhE protein